jgi:uncharacterized repeat protein (TIGR01451 family)
MPACLAFAAALRLALASARRAAWALVAACALQGAAHAATFPADMCVGDRMQSGLNCTANDVQITNVRIAPGSGAPPTCEGGASITLDLEVTVNFGSSTRYDVGIFLSQDGASPMEQSTRTVVGGTGSASCKVATLPSPPPPLTSPTAQYPFPNKDAGPYLIGGQQVYDSCGDGSGNSLFGNAGSATFIIPQVTVQCKSLNSTGSLNIPFVVTWDSDNQNSGNVCTGPSTVIPSGKSKCSSSSGTQADVAVVTMPRITKTDGIASITPNDTVTYTVTVSNTTGVTLANAVFKDPAVPNLAVASVTCAAQYASCPTTSSVALMQGAGLVIPSMAPSGTVTFTIAAQLRGNPVGNLTNSASITVNGATNTATDTDVIVYPALVNAKTVTVLSDPVNGITNPKSIPGSESLYTISVTNTGPGRVDNDTVRIVDAVPANTMLYVGNLVGGSGPVSFSDAGSGLTYTWGALSSTADDIEFSRDGGATWGYTPAPDASGYDAAVTTLRVNPKGRMNGWSGSGAYPGFNLAFKLKLK